MSALGTDTKRNSKNKKKEVKAESTIKQESAKEEETEIMVDGSGMYFDD